MRIREESPSDYEEIHSLIRTAFETAKVKSGDEQNYAANLREAGGYINELALVAVEHDKLIGHVMLTRTKLRTDDDRRVRVLLLAPLSVLLEFRNQGVGAALVREALRRAAEMEFDGVFLVGDPKYYNRLGFKAASEFGVEYTGDIPPEFVLACELRPGALFSGAIGTEQFH